MALDLSPQHIATLRLMATPRIGPVAYKGLMQRFGTPQKALDALPQLMAKSKRHTGDIATEATVLKEAEALAKLGGRYVFLQDDAYPAQLAAIEDAPPVLRALGNIELLPTDGLALVGTRNASANGQKFTRTLAADLSKQGYTITSGMARGIDTAAHEGALDAAGRTIAVLGGGVDHIYPKENKPLYEKLIKEGLILSELAVGAAPAAHHFPRRNRIVSGLSKGVVVVEAARKSGSLISARLAAEQGRDVFAVPGHPSDSRAQGPNHLIKQGAQLIETAQDVLDQLGTSRLALFVAEAPTPWVPDTPVAEAEIEQGHNTLATLLSTTPITVDELVRQSGMAESAVLAALMEMEILGEIERLPGARVALQG